MAAIVFAAVHFGDGKFKTVKKGKDSSGLDTIKYKFAEGGIDKEEYEERKAVLERDGAK